VLGDNLDPLSDEVGGVEANTELTNHGNVRAGAERLHEALESEGSATSRYYGRASTTYLRAGLGDRTEVVDHVGFGHADTGVTNRKNLVLLVGGYADVELLLLIENGRVCKRGVTDLVERIGAVRDDLAKENLLVAVEGVYTLDECDDTRCEQTYTH
jgi:hypothetical protein